MYQPLADLLRPQTLDDVFGQDHILNKGAVLRRLIESGNIPNMIFYGPSGTGKTTVAKIIAQQTNRTLYQLNATTASTADIKEIAAQFDKDMRNTILLAEKLGIDTIITFSGCPGSDPDAKLPSWVTCPWPDDFLATLDYQWNEVLIPYWKETAAFAKQHGIKDYRSAYGGFASRSFNGGYIDICLGADCLIRALDILIYAFVKREIKAF